MNETKSNCIECELKLSILLMVEGRCPDCNLDHKIETRQLNET